jgi:hypothetical protein
VPSASLLQWQNDRMARLQQVDLQCAASLIAAPPNAHLIEENLRGYVVLLSAHFQGFCRDLYTEAAQIIASKVRPSLGPLVQRQFTAHRKLDHGNPTHDHLKAGFERFGLKLDLTVDPANVPRLTHLSALNKWRNVAAHQGTAPAGIPLDLPSLQTWRSSCDGLALSLNGIVYDQLRKILRRAPWRACAMEVSAMSTQKSAQPFNVGDRVQILHSIWRGRIVEFRGPLGPGGMLIYRVRIAGKPRPTYIEVREDQLAPLPTPPKLRVPPIEDQLAPPPAPPTVNAPVLSTTAGRVRRPTNMNSKKRSKPH